MHSRIRARGRHCPRPSVGWVRAEDAHPLGDRRQTRLSTNVSAGPVSVCALASTTYTHPGDIVNRIPRPAEFRRLLPLAWLSARAFTANRLAAGLVVPCMVFLLAPYMVRGAVFESCDHHGLVVVARHRPALSQTLTCTLVLLAIAPLVPAYVAVLGTPQGPLILMAAEVLALASLWPLTRLLQVQPSRTVGPETPTGTRYEIANLAQCPGTRMSAILLAKELISSLPEGSILVAAARNDELLKKYVRVGFTQGEERRVYRVL